MSISSLYSHVVMCRCCSAASALVSRRETSQTQMHNTVSHIVTTHTYTEEYACVHVHVHAVTVDYDLSSVISCGRAQAHRIANCAHRPSRAIRDRYIPWPVPWFVVPAACVVAPLQTPHGRRTTKKSVRAVAPRAVTHVWSHAITTQHVSRHQREYATHARQH